MARAPQLTFRCRPRYRASRCRRRYVLGTSRGAISQGAVASDRPRDRGGHHRPDLAVLLSARRGGGDRQNPQEIERVLQGDRVAPVELWNKLSQRFALIGVQGVVRMAMAGVDVAAWDALAIAAGLPLASLLGSEPEADSCLQLLRSRADGLAGCGGRRGGEAPRRRFSRAQAAARLSDAGGGSRRRARGAAAHRRGHSADGRLQPGAQPRRGAGARPSARSGEHLLARGADPSRRLSLVTRRSCVRSPYRSRSARIFPKAARWRPHSRLALPITSCPISSVSAGSPDGSEPLRSQPPTVSRCRRISFPK